MFPDCQTWEKPDGRLAMGLADRNQPFQSLITAKESGFLAKIDDYYGDDVDDDNSEGDEETVDDDDDDDAMGTLEVRSLTTATTTITLNTFHSCFSSLSFLRSNV